VCLLPLSKALDSIERGTSVLQVDLKGQASRNEIEQVVSAIQKRRLSERVVLFCDPLVECELVRDVTASIHIMARAHEASDLARLLNILSWAVQVDEKILSDRLLGKLRKQGVLVMVKTLDAAADTAEHWSRLEKSGVDLILTDYPRAARRQLCRQ
jgi:glycerophosphoryl diester phosphodiesterase